VIAWFVIGLVFGGSVWVLGEVFSAVASRKRN